MKWSLNELRQAGSEPIMVNEELDLTSALKKRRPEIISASKVAVQGLFSVDKLGVLGYFKVQVELTLPSTRSLEPTVLPLSFEVTEHYVSYHEHDLSGFEDTDVVIVLDKDILDFDRVIEDNILLQIPMQSNKLSPSRCLRARTGGLSVKVSWNNYEKMKKHLILG